MMRLACATVTTALMVGVLACGGSAAAPAPPASFSLADGAYTLLIFSPPGSQCFATRFGSATPPNATISVNTTVARDGSDWVIRMADDAAGTLSVRLGPEGAGAAGRAVGTAFSPGRDAMVTVDHALSGTQAGTGATGAIVGDVQFVSVPPGASTACSTTAWTLTRR